MNASPSASPCLLVVDDNAENRDVLARRLRRLGYANILTAEDGREALDHVEAQFGLDAPVDIMLLDVMMPRMSGVEVLGTMALDPRMSGISVLMISADTDLSTIVRCIELGADDYLPKPFNPILLRARLSSIVEKRRLRREVDRQLVRLERELAEARLQQLSMVPDRFPDGGPSHRVSIHAAMHPAREVGGDLYDCFEVVPGVICVAIGDVSDKGVPAALYMARTRSLIRSSALQHARDHRAAPDASGLVRTINEELCKNNDACMFVTLFVGLLDLATGHMDFVNAGHPPPWIADETGALRIVEAPVSPPLGILPDLVHPNHSVTLTAGTLFVAITDGLPEMTDATGEFYTMERVASDIAAHAAQSPETIVRILAERVRAFAGEAPPADDVTILALRRHV